jgi:hypothetical protein
MDKEIECAGFLIKETDWLQIAEQENDTEPALL